MVCVCALIVHIIWPVVIAAGLQAEQEKGARKQHKQLNMQRQTDSSWAGKNLTRKNISRELFEQKIYVTHSYHDVIRLFYDQTLPDFIIEELLMYGLPEYHVTNNTHRQRSAPQSPNHSKRINRERTRKARQGLKGKRGAKRRRNSGKKTARRRRNIPKDKHSNKSSRKQNKNRNKSRRRKGSRPKSSPTRDVTVSFRQEPVLQDIAEAHRDMLHMWRSTQCGTPRVAVTCLHDMEDRPGRAHFPPCTIVHRCDNTSGCCAVDEICGPKEQEIFTKQIFVLKYDEKNNLSPDNPFIQSFNFTNHTQCHCQKRNLIPDCFSLNCPDPFSAEVSSGKCACKCHKDKEKCLRIASGQKALSSRALSKCKREGHCQMPTCDEGKTFNPEKRLCQQTHSEDTKSVKTSAEPPT